MPFPEVGRVLYKNNPLEMVACQLRFPPILRIDADLPVAFQDRVRAEFPGFRVSSEFRIEMPSGSGEQIPPEIIRQVIQSSGTKNYEFASTDGNWKINLTRTFIALSTKQYIRWEQFRDRFLLPFNALQEIYSPSYFSRIGLRYINKIRRSGLGLSEVPWRDLLTPDLIGMLNSSDMVESIDGIDITHRLRLAEEGGNARLVSKLDTEGDPPEQVFTIDGDYFYSAKSEVATAIDRLNFLNTRSSRLIRWAFTDRLHKAMEPEPL
jgi:uncharacterized protein (TIGR04255 family)